MTKKCCLYARVSTVDQHVETQLYDLRLFAQQRGYEVVGEYTDWTPLYQRGELFAEDLDTADPWQFKNIRVV